MSVKCTKDFKMLENNKSRGKRIHNYVLLKPPFSLTSFKDEIFPDSKHLKFPDFSLNITWPVETMIKLSHPFQHPHLWFCSTNITLGIWRNQTTRNKQLLSWVRLTIKINLQQQWITMDSLLENQDFSHCFIFSKCVFASIDSTENIILLSNPLDSLVYSVV